MSSSCRASCTRKYPRLVSNLFWLYLLTEGLCFVVDVAFVSTTVMAARNGSLRTNSTATNAEGVPVLDDDYAYQLSLEPNQPTTRLRGNSATKSTEVTPGFSWETFQTLLLEQFKLQWEQQEAFIRGLLIDEEVEEQQIKVEQG